MQYIYRLALLIGGLICGSFAFAQETSEEALAELWNKNFASAKEIVESYKAAKKQVANQKVLNNCWMVWQSGEYVLNGKGEQQDLGLLLASLPSVDLNNKAVLTFMQKKGVLNFIDSYYMLRALKRGDAFEEARDHLSFTTRFPFRLPNHNDYAKLHDVFSQTNAALHEPYLKIFEFVFLNNGCTDGLKKLRSLIEKNVADGRWKQKALELYAKYEPIGKGMPAPQPVLKDASGKTVTFADFRGKIIVVDVWATWCSSCLKKMPNFIALKDAFADSDVVFMVLSTDRNKALPAWEKAVEKYGLDALTNLRADVENGSSFESDYCVFGLPRYIVIDREGKIVEAFAPSPGEELKQLIEQTINQ